MKRTTFQLIIMSLVLVPLGGCNLTPDQRVAGLQKAITQTQAVSKDMDARIIQLEALISRAKGMLADPNMTNETLVYLRDALPKLEAKLVAAKPIKAIVDQNLVTLQKQFADAVATGPLDTQKEFTAYGQGVTMATAALPAPFNLIGLVIGSLVLPLVGGIVGAVAKGKKDQTQLADKNTAIKGIVDSVEALLGNSTLVSDASAAKKELAYFQAKNAPLAAAAVQAVKDARA